MYPPLAGQILMKSVSSEFTGVLVSHPDYILERALYFELEYKPGICQRHPTLGCKATKAFCLVSVQIKGSVPFFLMAYRGLAISINSGIQRQQWPLVPRNSRTCFLSLWSWHLKDSSNPGSETGLLASPQLVAKISNLYKVGLS